MTFTVSTDCQKLVTTAALTRVFQDVDRANSKGDLRRSVGCEAAVAANLKMTANLRPSGGARIIKQHLQQDRQSGSLTSTNYMDCDGAKYITKTSSLYSMAHFGLFDSSAGSALSPPWALGALLAGSETRRASHTASRFTAHQLEVAAPKVLIERLLHALIESSRAASFNKSCI